MMTKEVYTQQCGQVPSYCAAVRVAMHIQYLLITVRGSDGQYCLSEFLLCAHDNS